MSSSGSSLARLPSPEQLASERARRSLSRFIREAWPVVEPGAAFQSGWHIDAICEHLEAVSRCRSSGLPGSGHRAGGIGQRVHERDLFGHLLAQGGWTHLCLPADYEPSHPFVWPDDPRSEPGELLCPERFGAEHLSATSRTPAVPSRPDQQQDTRRGAR